MIVRGAGPIIHLRRAGLPHHADRGQRLGVIDAKLATSAAAREVVQAVVELHPGEDLQRRAEYLAASTLEGYGRDTSEVAVTPLPQDDALIDPSCEVVTGQSGGAPLATVSCTARVRFVFTPAIPGARNLREVTANETAVGRQG